jgi:Na+-transporting NADH:ubiquinone oxidoreductase subunit NqrB
MPRLYSSQGICHSLSFLLNLLGTVKGLSALLELAWSMVHGVKRLGFVTQLTVPCSVRHAFWLTADFRIIDPFINGMFS